MTTIQLDDTGDILIANGSIQMISGKDAMVQSLNIVLQERKGEWFFDKDEGLDFDVMMAVPFNDERCSNALVDAASKVPDFKAFTSIMFTMDERRCLTASVQGVMNDGTTFSVEEVLTK